MTCKLLLLAFFVQCTVNAFAAEIVSAIGGTAAGRVVAIDTTTGAIRTIVNMSLPGSPGTTLISGLSAYDSVDHRLYFVTADSNFLSYSLVSLDVVNGTSSTFRTFLSPFLYTLFEWDSVNRQIIALSLNEPGSPVVSLGPGGTLIHINTNIPPVPLLYGSAFDPVSRQYYFMMGNPGQQKLVTVNLATGTVSTRSIPVPYFYGPMEWDGATHRIITGIASPGRPVVSLNPTTGVIETLFDTNAGGSPAHAFDQVSRQLYLIDSTGPGTQQLAIVDLQTRTVTRRSIATAGFYGFFELVTSASEIPTLDSKVLLVLVTLVAAIGCFILRVRAS